MLQLHSQTQCGRHVIRVMQLLALQQCAVVVHARTAVCTCTMLGCFLGRGPTGNVAFAQFWVVE